MNEELRQALREAVARVNSIMNAIRKEGGGSVIVRPIANYNINCGFARIEVEVTTGRERFGIDD